MTDYMAGKGKIEFPPVYFADADGLLAWGGDLRPETLLQAYSHGIFPWTVKPVTWWSPDPRAIFEIDNFNLSRRMERLFRKNIFSYSINQAFGEVIRGCSRPGPGREQTWISPEFISAYERMHKLGYAHSSEVWLNNELAGGLYGIAIGGFFAGESMFHNFTNASTLCLRFFLQYLKKQGFELFDSQVISAHTRRLGAIEIPRSTYLQRLKKAVLKDCRIENIKKKNSML
jgi:leucyl/phenylalanyl-tRNA--protein transferase